MHEIKNAFVGYGFVDSISKPAQGTNSNQRLDIVLDFISAGAVDFCDSHSLNVENLSIVRIMTTSGRLENLFNLKLINEGSWLKVSLGHYPGNPLAWVSEARADYVLGTRTNVIGIEKIMKTRGSSHGQLFSSLSSLCNPPVPQLPDTTSPLQQSLLSGQNAYYLRVVDVGQASFCAIHTARNPDSTILGYFDVGAPLFFHRRSFPSSTFAEYGRVPKDGFVALSHWDFDHYSMAVTRLKNLQDLKWFAPNQAVGPNAARLQSLLGANLTLLDTGSFAIAHGLKLYRGIGRTNDRNNNGFVLTASVAGGIALLAGDASYDSIPLVAKNGLVGLNIAHHGGATTGSPPIPACSHGVAAVSYGTPNRYRHPDITRLREHMRLGWQVRPTCPAKNPRGDVWLQ